MRIIIIADAQIAHMLLTFIRHAEASLSAAVNFKRELTERGKQQAHQLAAFFSRLKNQPQLVLTSPVVRARQTAEAISQRLESARLLEQSWLASGMAPEIYISELRAFSQFENVLLVGHEPDLSSTIAFLLGNQNPENLKMRKASICALKIQSLGPGCGILQYFLPPDLLLPLS